jgi:hypothetical protein
MIFTQEEKTAFKAGVRASREGAEAFNRDRQLAAIESTGEQTRAQQNRATFKWMYLNSPHPQHRSLSA